MLNKEFLGFFGKANQYQVFKGLCDSKNARCSHCYDILCKRGKEKMNEPFKVKGVRHERKKVFSRKNKYGRFITKKCWNCETILRPEDNYDQEIIVYTNGNERLRRVFCADEEKNCKEKSVGIINEYV